MAKPLSDTPFDTWLSGPANTPVPARTARRARVTHGLVRAPASDLTFLFKARHRRTSSWQTRVDRKRKTVAHTLSRPAVINATALPLADQRQLRERLAGRTRTEAGRRATHFLLSPPPEIILIPAVELKFRTVAVTLAGRNRREMPLRAPRSRLLPPGAVQGSSLPVSRSVASSGGSLSGMAIISAAPVLVRAPAWRWVVTNLHHRTLTFLDHIAYNRSLLYTLNKPSTATGIVDSDNPEINIVANDGDPFLAEGNRFLLGFRREGGTNKWRIRFSGIILQIEDYVDVDAPKSAFTAYDPWEYLNHRPVRKADGSLPGEAGLTFAGQRGDEIAHALIRRTVDQDGTIYTDIGAAGGTAYYGGTMQATPHIDITFAQGCTVGDALTQLCDSGTLDIYFSPIHDPANRPGLISELNIYNMMGHKMYGTLLGWDKPGRNLVNIDRLEDGTQRANVVQYFRTNSIPVGAVSDAASYAVFGKYWDTQTFQSEYPVSAVESLAAETLLVRKGHPTTIKVTPSPEISPVPFTEYFLGDQLPIAASRRLRKQVAALGRVYSIPIDLDDNSVEKVPGLEFSSDALSPIPESGDGGGGSSGGDTGPFSVSITGSTGVGDTLTAVIT